MKLGWQSKRLAPSVPVLPAMPAGDVPAHAQGKLVIAMQGMPDREIPLNGDRLLLGRGEEADVRIDSVFVSRYHALIVRDNGQYIRDTFNVERVEVEMWDRSELIATLRSVHDLSADRCEKTLAQWLGDLDNGLLLNQFQRDMMAEALQMRASDIHLLQDNNPASPNWVKYRIDGDLVPMHLLPAEGMARLTTLETRSGNSRSISLSVGA